MIIKDEDAIKRLNSPINLINRLRRENGKDNKKNNAMSLFGIRQAPPERTKTEPSFNPFQPLAATTSPIETPSELPSAPAKQEDEPNLDTILKNNNSLIKLSLAHDNAVELLNASVSALSAKLDDVRADRLPAVISAASKTVESIRRERLEASKNNKDREVHYHFYTPEQKKIEQYEVIDVA